MKKLPLLIIALAVITFAAGAASAPDAKDTPTIKVTVTGCVGRPGVVTLGERRELSIAVALAGSFTRYAEKRDITVTSKTGEQKTYDFNVMAKKGEQGPELRDGDVVFVPER